VPDCLSLMAVAILTAGWLLGISYTDYLIARQRRFQSRTSRSRPLTIEQLLRLPWEWAAWVASGVVVFGIAFVAALLDLGVVILLGLVGFAAFGAMLFADWQQLQRVEPTHRSSTSNALLEGTGGEYARRRVPLYQHGMIIGRSKECGLLLREHAVSRQHARIRWADGAWFIQDLNSSGGTFVNRQRIQATRLNPGDQIRIGSSTFIFRT
jgi:hypothetical protein